MNEVSNLQEVILATTNTGKVRELVALLADLPASVSSLADWPEPIKVIEDGITFEENAIKKAKEVAQRTGKIALADDSGLEVDALGGAPGVYSARFAGENATDAENNQKLLEMLQGIPLPKRTARFRCAVAIATPQGKVVTTMGTCEGLIGEMPQGEHGFGYDPLFYVPEYGKTFAELELVIKNQISHRAKAFWKAKEELRNILQVFS